MSELFDVSSFSSLDDATRDFQLENLSSKKKIGKRCRVPLSLGTHAATDPAWDNESAFPEVSSKKICALGDTCGTPCGERSEVESSEEKEGFKVGDRIETDGSEETEIVSVTVSNTNKSKSSDCWYTPLEIVTLIQNCLQGITLDPCADDGKHIESCYHFTIADDGLSRQWFGRVFMNPPYSCPGVWIAKLQEEFNCGRVEEAMPAAGQAKFSSTRMDDGVPSWLGGKSIDGWWPGNINTAPIYPGVRHHLNKRRECNDLYARSVCPLQAAIAIKRVCYLAQNASIES